MDQKEPVCACYLCRKMLAESTDESQTADLQSLNIPRFQPPAAPSGRLIPRL